MDDGANVILIGMPGVGKSTVGVLLAKQLGYGFIDTDLLIQTGEGRRLQQIIEERGLEGFCDLEADYIGRVSGRRQVIATGGSVVYRPTAMAHLAHLGPVVYLAIDLDRLKARLGNLESRGVVIAPGQRIDDIYARRRPLYQKHADITVDCNGLSPARTVRAIETALPPSVRFIG